MKKTLVSWYFVIEYNRKWPKSFHFHALFVCLFVSFEGIAQFTLKSFFLSSMHSNSIFFLHFCIVVTHSVTVNIILSSEFAFRKWYTIYWCMFGATNWHSGALISSDCDREEDEKTQQLIIILMCVNRFSVE